jgi:hypothetical protein
MSYRQKMHALEERERLTKYAADCTKRDQDHKSSLSDEECFAEGYVHGYEDGRDNYTGALENSQLGFDYPHTDAYTMGYRSGWTNGNRELV